MITNFIIDETKEHMRNDQHFFLGYIRCTYTTVLPFQLNFNNSAKQAAFMFIKFILRIPPQKNIDAKSLVHSMYELSDKEFMFVLFDQPREKNV